MKLYTYFRSSAAFRVRIALNLKGVRYEAVPVNLLKGEQKAEGYRLVNPQGRVPSLDLGTTVLTQSPALLEYLDEVYPEPPLLPVGAVQRAKVRAVASIVACDIHPLNNSGTLAYLKNRLGHDQAAMDAWYAHWVREGFDAIEKMIEPGPYAFGNRVTLADLYLVPQVFNARRFNVPLDDYPKIRAVDAACADLPAFRDAAPANQPDAA
ncbi:maleylacetoacetate isomerase [Microvirga thermotolerans]|uniref:Maleylacetoacetate isomerase n=1 Tax=Microvirga thermotolerans TaxID=2651334 RepID=A0A5P9JXP1_9HYPH|nr:maleylacetoacetate isomerase [Microvirga thermotolerans]QFU16180.1 maleylacetoacetate isomerase [Microvirga thermotolerans]